MPYVDYFCPMVYPSHYGPGVFGFAIPNDHPYDVINNTLKIMNRQAAGLAVSIRPWIQDFGYGSFAPYTASQILAEKKAASDNGTSGWMTWNARATFTEAALIRRAPGEDSGPLTGSWPGTGRSQRRLGEVAPGVPDHPAVVPLSRPPSSPAGSAPCTARRGRTRSPGSMAGSNSQPGAPGIHELQRLVDHLVGVVVRDRETEHARP